MKKRLMSIPFFLLRATTAGAALLTGLLQTYVFAHVLSPERFAIFILVGAVGYSVWLMDFGIVKILFVRLRARFLSRDKSDAVAGHATAVVLFYFALVSTAPCSASPSWLRGRRCGRRPSSDYSSGHR